MRRTYPVLALALAWLGMGACAVAANFVLLPVEDAFSIAAHRVSARSIAVDFQIAPGYVLYRDRLAFASDTPRVQLVNAVFPMPTVKFDKAMDKEEAFYSGQVRIRFDIAGATVPFKLSVQAQGCEFEQGVCYPPIRKEFQVPSVK